MGGDERRDLGIGNILRRTRGDAALLQRDIGDARGREDDRQADRPTRRLAAPAQVEDVADRHAGQPEQGQHEPGPLRAIGHWIMVAEHDQQHRQGHVIVVQRALLGLCAELWIGGAPGDQIGDDLLLVGNDDQEDVGDHCRTDDGADMDIGGARVEQAVQQMRREEQADEPEEAEQHIVLAERRAAEQVVDQPADDQSRKADRDARAGAELRPGRIDQIALRAEIINEHQQRESADPGEIGLIFEPVQMLRHRGRRDLIFLVMVEAAAMDRPELARGVAGGRLLQMVVQPDEIE